MDFQSLHEPVSNWHRKINERDKKCDFPQEFPTPTRAFPAVVGVSGRRTLVAWKGIRGVKRRGFGSFRQDGWKTRRLNFCGGGPPGMLFHLPHLNLCGIHVPEHFTGIWVQGKPRQPGKSVITLELPISYDRYCCFQCFSKEATEWLLCSPQGLVAIQSDPSQRG